MLVLIQVSGKKEDPEGIELLRILYGNFIKDEYTYDLRLESELSDLQSWYAHTDKVGILPGEEMVCADITISVISTNNTPSGNTHIQNAKRFEWVR